jgi:hypothetical protein
MMSSPRVRALATAVVALSVSLCTTLISNSANATSPTRASASLQSYLAHRGITLAHRVSARASATVTVTPSAINTPSGGLATLSCASASFCVAVDNNGGALTYNGTSWAGPVTIDSGVALDAVSCAAETFCVATDVSGNYLIDNAGTWSTPKAFVAASPGADLALSVACPTTTYCLAVGMTPNTTPILPDVMFYDNGTWHQQTDNALTDDVFDSVSCLSRASCAAVTYGGYYVSFTAPTVNGASETANFSSAAQVDAADAVSGLTSISCASATYCAAADGYGDLLIDSSGTWHAALSELPQASNAFVSCSSVTSGSVSGNNCIAIDDVGETAASSGTGWLSGDPGSASDSIVGFTCTNDANCLGVDYNGFAITVVETLNSYSLVTTQLSQYFDEPNNVTTLSCVSATSSRLCFAGDAAGNIYTSTGGSWTLLTHLIDQSSGVVALSCAGVPTSYVCWVLDSEGNPYFYSQGTWQTIVAGTGPLLSPVGVSCSTTNACLAVDQSYDAVRYSDQNLLSFGATVIPASDSSSAIPLALSCVPGQSRCVVVDSSGFAFISSSGSNWVATNQFVSDPSTEAPTAISCPTTTFCAAVDDAGNAYFLNSSTWSSADAVTAEPLVAISCVSAYRCVASDDLGNAFIYDGNSWTEVSQVAASGDYLQGISCLTLTTCVVSDSSTSYLLTVSSPSNTTTSIPAIASANRTAGHLVVAVKVAGNDAPVGTVTISRGATSCAATLVAGANSANWSSASCTMPAPGIIGTTHLSAVYHGSLNDAASQATLSTTLGAEPTSTSLSLQASSVKLGSEQKDRYSVVVTPKHAGLVPSGSVTVQSGTVKLCTIKLNKAVGSCTPSRSALARGSHKLTASYVGTATLVKSTSSAHTLTIK